MDTVYIEDMDKLDLLMHSENEMDEFYDRERFSVPIPATARAAYEGLKVALERVQKLDDGDDADAVDADAVEELRQALIAAYQIVWEDKAPTTVMLVEENVISGEVDVVGRPGLHRSKRP